MRTKPTSLAVAMLAAALLVFSACGDEGAAPRATATSPSTSPTPTASSTPSATSSPTVDATEIEIEVEDGEVKGPGEVSVDAGERIVLVVQADVTDEVHVHGYDQLAEVSPGNPATIRFRADLVGVYEVELESAAQLLLRLRVNP